MWWIIIIAIVGYIIYKYFSDRNKLLSRIESKGGLQVKYQKLISILLGELPGARIIQVTRDTIVINWNMGQFTIFQLFDKIRITWRMNLPSGPVKDSIELPKTLDQQLMVKQLDDEINSRIGKINGSSEYEAINNIINQEVPHLDNRNFIRPEFNNNNRIIQNIVRPGKGYDGIILNVTTFKDVVERFGNDFAIEFYDSTSYDSKAFSMFYKNLGISCIFEEDDPERHIRSIELFKESDVMTEYGIDFKRNNTALKVLTFHGPLEDDKITEDEQFLSIDYGEIQFYFHKGNNKEFEDIELTKIRLKEVEIEWLEEEED